MSAPIAETRQLRFRYRGSPREVLAGIDMVLEPGQRCLLIGANGAGKTTLLRILAGKHMVPHEVAQVLGRSAFHDTSLADEVEFLGGPFPFEVDVRVGALLDGVMGVEPARRQALVRMLEIDVDWHMHAVSDGQRRRVQICLGLLRPSRLLLLDEVTTDLDLLARGDLLSFLRQETEAEGTAILYATHIFDALDDWATHILYLRGGRVALHAPLDEIPELLRLREERVYAPLLKLVDGWLRRDANR
jgi:CCR4-NOT complex subunit CAF16